MDSVAEIKLASSASRLLSEAGIVGRSGTSTPVARLIRKYRAELLKEPTSFAPAEEADAEPAVPGWRIPVDRIFV